MTLSIDKKSKKFTVSLLFNKLETASGSRGGGLEGEMSRGEQGYRPPPALRACTVQHAPGAYGTVHQTNCGGCIPIFKDKLVLLPAPYTGSLV